MKTKEYVTKYNLSQHIIVAADCTGHGVPGALVSVVCHNALNRAVKEYNKIMPAEILDVVAELVLENFSTDIQNILEPYVTPYLSCKNKKERDDIIYKASVQAQMREEEVKSVLAWEKRRIQEKNINRINLNKIQS
jgi:hypothetical protein